MAPKIGTRVRNREIIYFFRNLTQFVGFTGSKTKLGYVFLAQFPGAGADIVLSIDRATNTLSMVKTSRHYAGIGKPIKH